MNRTPNPLDGHCGTCWYWHSRNRLEGSCRRLSPRERDPETGEARWPLTRARDFCGEWAETNEAWERVNAA